MGDLAIHLLVIHCSVSPDTRAHDLACLPMMERCALHGTPQASHARVKIKYDKTCNFLHKRCVLCHSSQMAQSHYKHYTNKLEAHMGCCADMMLSVLQLPSLDVCSHHSAFPRSASHGSTAQEETQGSTLGPCTLRVIFHLEPLLGLSHKTSFAVVLLINATL